jgi:hypothetical protein
MAWFVTYLPHALQDQAIFSSLTDNIMKNNIICLGMALCIFGTSGILSSCKNKNKPDESSATTTATPDYGTTTAPVEIASDAQLEQGVRDAVKDYPGVTATVANGEVTLTGTIARDDLSRLMPTIQSLNPKKVNNNLTIQ